MAIANAVGRTPNRSRIRSDRPCPVTTPRRAAISWTIASTTIVIGNSHSSENPLWAPMTLYVVMPPASLPAIPAMRPGPMTARKASRPRRPRNRPRRRRNSSALNRSEAPQVEPHASGQLRDDGRSDPAPPAGRQDRVDGVVHGDDADEPPLGVDHRDGQQVVAGDHAGDLVAVGQDVDRDRLVDHHLADRRGRLRHDQVAQRQDADQPAGVVDHVDVVDRLGVGLELAQPLDRLGGREVRLDRDELGGHRPAGGVLGVGEQAAELLGLVALHQGEQLLAGLVGQVGDQVGRVVGRHLLEDVGRAFRREALEDLDLRVRLHLLDRVGGGLVVEGGQDAGPVARRQLVDDRGQVGRMQLGQAGVRDAELDRRDAGLDRVDVLPVDVALGRRAG